MNKLYILFAITSTFLISCYTETKKPDYAFMKTIKNQASLDSSLRTTILITPKKYYYRSIRSGKMVNGSFYVKNTGTIDFHIVSIKSICDCTKISYAASTIIPPNDSLKVTYEMKTNNLSGVFQNAIIAVGNCQYGNQTYYFEGTIN